MEKTTLNVTGMSCDHCVKTVNKVLGAITGVTNIVISLRKGTASFKYDPALMPLEAIKAAIKDEGYGVDD